MRFTLALTATAWICYATTAFAADAGSPAAPLPTALGPSVKAGAHATYLGKVGDLQGWLLTRRRPDGSVLAVPAYVTPDGDQLILGHAHNSDGTDITQLQENRLALRINEAQSGVTPSPPLDIGVPSPTPSIAATQETATAEATSPATAQNTAQAQSGLLYDPQAFASAVRSATANFSVGRHGAPLIYLVSDQSCDACTALAASLRPLAGSGQIELTVITTSLHGDDRRSLTLLAAKRPAYLWFTGTDPDTGQTQPNDTTKSWLAANNAFAKRLGDLPGPLLAYFDTSGKWTIQTSLTAAPSDLSTASLGPKQP